MMTTCGVTWVKGGIVDGSEGMFGGGGATWSGMMCVGKLDFQQQVNLSG